MCACMCDSVTKVSSTDAPYTVGTQWSTPRGLTTPRMPNTESSGLAVNYSFMIILCQVEKTSKTNNYKHIRISSICSYINPLIIYIP